IFEFGEGLLHARNAHGEGGWLKELSVPRVGTVGYFCSASLGQGYDWIFFYAALLSVCALALTIWLSRRTADQTYPA
ncbi:hypothetical protein, partial [Pseudomonas syringae]|uniref:hypothetical protein n=1 Tax=Pseudomonas syringae TaxID=317 RepID=UPI001C556BC2